MKINKKTIRSWILKIAAVVIVLLMVFAGFVVIFWK